MPEETKPEKVKRQRKPPRNFGKIIADLEAYCLATIDVTMSDLPSEFGKGRIAFAEKVLKKLKGEA